jgi:hypothetical protein
MLLYLLVGSFWFQHWYVVWALAPAALMPHAQPMRRLLPWLGFGALAANVVSAFAPALAGASLSKLGLAALTVAVTWAFAALAGSRLRLQKGKLAISARTEPGFPAPCRHS